MAKSKSEVIAEAHRRIGVLSVDEEPSADMISYAGDAADSLLAELNSAPHNMAFFWTTETVPDPVFRPFAWLLAVDLAAHYQVPAPNTRARALMAVRAFASPDDRPNRLDLDQDGIVTADEEVVAVTGQYF